ncbi:MAG TPA: hypothetical protein PLH46_02990 [Caldisericia bacterium]|nr:hypothetical protein [Caldisericia bacterium]
MIKLKNDELILRINFNKHNTKNNYFAGGDVIDFKNIFVGFDIENKIVKTYDYRVLKNFYDSI